MSEKYNVPEQNSLDSAKGVEKEIGYDKKNIEKFESQKEDFYFIEKIEEGVKESLGRFDIFDDNFFTEVCIQKKLLRDYNPRGEEITHGFFYVSLDIFNRLLEKELLKENDKEIFCFSFSDSHFIQSEIEKYLKSKMGLNNKPNVNQLHILIEKYLPNIENLANRDNINEIDDAIRERCFEIKLGNEFAIEVYDIDYNATSIDDWEKDKIDIWENYIDKNYKKLKHNYPEYLFGDLDKISKFARYIHVVEPLTIRKEIITHQDITTTVNWRDVIMRGLKTFGGDESLDFYSIKRLKKILLEIKAEYNF